MRLPVTITRQSQAHGRVLAKTPVWGTLVLAGLVLLLTLGYFFDPDSVVPTWLASVELAAGLLLVARTSMEEIRAFPAYIRVANFWRTTEVPLDKIVGVLPEPTRPGVLRLEVKGRRRPLPITVSQRHGRARERLREKIVAVITPGRPEID